jgi:hypothetical protein
MGRLHRGCVVRDHADREPLMPSSRDSFFISYTKSYERSTVWIAWELEAAGFNTTITAWDFRRREGLVRRMHDELTIGSGT